MPAVLGQVSEPIRHFPWPVYVLAGAAYSALAFRGELPREGALIFSKQNARPLSTILAIHLAFLTILLGLLWLAPYIEPFLPIWLTDDTYLVGYHGSTYSVLEYLFIFLMIGMHCLERRWLYLKAKETGPNTDDKNGGWPTQRSFR